MAYELKKVIPKKWVSKTRIFCRKKNHSFLDPYQEWTPKWAKMVPEKPRNDPHMLKIPKIFDFYHKTLRLKFLYRGSTIYLIQRFLSIYKTIFHLFSHLPSCFLKNFKAQMFKETISSVNLTEDNNHYVWNLSFLFCMKMTVTSSIKETTQINGP